MRIKIPKNSIQLATKAVTRNAPKIMSKVSEVATPVIMKAGTYIKPVADVVAKNPGKTLLGVLGIGVAADDIHQRHSNKLLKKKSEEREMETKRALQRHEAEIKELKVQADNFLQFGSIGEEELTIAEIVQGMYYEGYDFIHFCSMSVPAMVTEVVVRLGYAIKRIKEGNKIKDSIPFSLNREKHPKLSTMLFVGHSAAVAVNAGKVAFTKNPMAINYPQWIAFAKYSYTQLKWGLIQKPALREKYVMGKINEELDQVLLEIDKGFDDFTRGYIVVIE